MWKGKDEGQNSIEISVLSGKEGSRWLEQRVKQGVGDDSAKTTLLMYACSIYCI